MRPSAAVALALLLALTAITGTEEAAAPPGPPDSEPTDALSCSLQHHLDGDSSQPCSPIAGSLPPRLNDLLKSDKVPPEFKAAAASSDFGTVSPAIMGDLPVLVVLHLSANFLATSSPRALSAIVRRHPGDVVVARAVLSALDLVDNEKRTRFIRELGLTSGLSVEVQAAIAASAAHWWGPEMEQHSMDLAMVGTPLLAALPPGFLAELDDERASKMLMRLRNHPWESPEDPAWSAQPAHTRRVWMTLFKRDAASGNGQLINPAAEGLRMLWAGATPDEIQDLQFTDGDRKFLTRLTRLSKLQTRGFLDKLYPKKALSSVDMNEVYNWMLELAPAGLQRFLANDTDFSSLPAADTSAASLPTLKQVLEQVVASMAMQGRVEDTASPGKWGPNLKDLGRLAYVLPAERLANYSRHQLPADVLTALDTYKLSTLQARYLTNNGKFLDLQRPLRDLEGVHGLTRALATSRLAALRTSTVSGDVMAHLVESLAPSHLGRASVLFNKVRPSLTEPKVLEAVLRNPAPAQYLSLVSSREVAADREALEKAFSRVKTPAARSRSFSTLGDWINSQLNLNTKDGIEEHLRFVPQDTLSALLGSARRELSAASNATSSPRRVVWTTDSLLGPDRPLVRGALLGLTCADVMAMDLVDLPVIVAALNRRLKEAGVGFPKRLHHCLQRAMEDYLAMKKRIRRFPDEFPLIGILEPSDIEAFGGFLLSALRPVHIQQSVHAKLILSAIGALPPQELVAAAPSLERLRELALQLVDLYRSKRSVGPQCLFALGSLHMFLPPDVITAIEPDAWRLFVEASAGAPLSLAVCAGSEQRDAWHRLTVRAFGSPSQWSAGVVAALGDVLAALPGDVLATVRQPSWRDAADTLAERTVYHRATAVAGSDRPQSFAEVCRSMLAPEERPSYLWGVRRAVRFYLRAALWMLDSVEDASTLVRRLGTRSPRKQWSYHQQQHRHAEATPTTTTTTTESSTSTTEDPFGFFSTAGTAATTEDPFGDFDDFLSARPAWLDEVLASTPAPVPETTTQTAPPPVPEPPRTVMLQKDDDAVSTTKVGDATTAAAATTAPEASTTLPEPKPNLLTSWESTDGSSTPAGLTTTTTSTTTAAAADQSTMAPQTTISLPPAMVALFPNESKSGGQLNLSSTTAKYSADLSDKGGAPQQALEASDADKDADGQTRRRRSAEPGVDAADGEEEHQLWRDVQIQVTCDALRVLGEASSLALVGSDPGHMLDAAVSDCAEELGRLRLGHSITRDLWEKIPPKERMELFGALGGLVTAMSVEEVPSLNLSLAHEHVVDTLSVIGSHVTDPAVLDAVASQLELQNPTIRAVVGAAGGDVDPDSLLVAVGPLVCSLPVDLQRLLVSRRGALAHAARSLQGPALTAAGRCNATCLVELAKAAMADAALGPPSSWTADDVRNLGVIVAGLLPEHLSELQRPLDKVEQPVSGISASALACMTAEQLQALGDHLGVLSPVAAAAVSPVQLQTLTSTQEKEVLRVRDLVFTRPLGREHLPDYVAPSAASPLQPAAPAATLLLAATLAFVYGRLG